LSEIGHEWVKGINPKCGEKPSANQLLCNTEPPLGAKTKKLRVFSTGFRAKLGVQQLHIGQNDCHIPSEMHSSHGQLVNDGLFSKNTEIYVDIISKG
jgi:hypothetical protein